MAISSIGSASDVNAISRTRTARAQQQQSAGACDRGGPKDSFRSDFAAMLQAIQSGDIGSAQTALQQLKQDAASSAGYTAPAATSSTAGAASTSSITDDLTSIFDAVSKGDIGAAQSAVQTFGTDVRASMPQVAQDAQDATSASGTEPAHRHHHKHAHGAMQAPPPPPMLPDFGSTDGSNTDPTDPSISYTPAS